MTAYLVNTQLILLQYNYETGMSSMFSAVQNKKEAKTFASFIFFFNATFAKDSILVLA